MDSAHGRVADDGTVFIRLPDGSEHSVGQWAAGDPSQGLAYFQRRYDDLVVEVDLTRKRMKSGNASPEDAHVVIDKITAAIATPKFVGDVTALEAKTAALAELITVRRAEVTAAKMQAKHDAAERRVAIAEEAEALANSSQWKSAGDKFRALLDEWKSLPRFDKGAEQTQWDRFSTARSTFDKARRQHFAELDATRAVAVGEKQKLILRAEALATSTDWGDTSRAYRDLMEEWKNVPRAGRKDDDRLWAEFRAAQDQFFDARNASNAERNSEETTNLAAKQELLVKIEALTTLPDHRRARTQLSKLIEDWDTIGYVPRADKPALDKRLRAVENKLRDAEQDHWRRTDPAAKARADSTVESFRTSYQKLEKQLASAQATGDARKVADITNSMKTSKMLLDAAESAASEFA